MKPKAFQRMRGATATIHVPTSAVYYEAAIGGLTNLNRQILAAAEDAGAPLPPIYQAAVRYKREPSDVWRHAVDVASSGWGDCEDLAAWRAAELQHTGEDPAAHVYVYQSGKNRYHAVVGRGDGTVEDPSFLLGMKVPRGWKPIQYVGQQRSTAYA